MRPFRFFFLLTLGIIFFFFIAKFLLFAAFLGLVFFAGRKALGYSRHPRQRPLWKGDMLVDYPVGPAERGQGGRIIEVQ